MSNSSTKTVVAPEYGFEALEKEGSGNKSIRLSTVNIICNGREAREA